MKYVVLEGRARRAADAAALRAEILARDGRCGACELNLILLGKRIARARVAYSLACLRLGRVPLLERDRLHPVHQALLSLGFYHDTPLAVLDHKVPLWAGGDDSLGNLQVLCQPCHREKTQEEAGQRKRLKKRAWYS